MSKRILFLYSDDEYKNEITVCERVFKTILRKFRETAVFTYLQIDRSPTCRNRMQERLLQQIKANDAAVINSDKEGCAEETAFEKDTLGLYATERFISGMCICSPVASKTVVYEDNIISENTVYSQELIRKAVKLCVNSASKRKRSITICTRPDSAVDKIIFRELENAFGEEKHISVMYAGFYEMIRQCISLLPFSDVILTTEDVAKTLSMHICASQKIPDGYILEHTDSGRIYRCPIFPHGQSGNSALMSLILAYSALMENELNMQTAAYWLRRSASLAFEQYSSAPQNEFLDKVIFEINQPMRQQRVKRL